MSASTSMPVPYLSHGAPPLADDAVWIRQLAAWSADLPRPAAVLIVSAHWENAPLTLGATTTVPLVQDFWGFPERYYGVTCAAPGAGPGREGAGAAGRPRHASARRADQGLDHGAYVPLVEMYPDGDVPVLQISMPSLDPGVLLSVGRRLAPLRDEGVLIVGSGFFTHNLSLLRMVDPAAAAPAWSAEFDQWGEEALARQEVDALLGFLHKAPSGRVAHPARLVR